MAKVVVSVRDLEQVKLLMFQIKSLIESLKEPSSKLKTPAEIGDHLERIIHRFMGTRLEDDRS